MPLTIKSIDPQRLLDLNMGHAASTILTENLAMDFAILMQATLPKLDANVIQTMQKAATQGIVKRMQVAAMLINTHLGVAVLPHLQHHVSDTLRGWACFIIANIEGMSLQERLQALQPYADDVHFGVREWAWLAVRAHLSVNLDLTIALLLPWTLNPSERIRRFACESIRPRGVWCTHIQSLKDAPEQALSILEALRADDAKYVQNSVANWLNDAAKTQPQWVQDVCIRWQKESPCEATQYVCKRALRSLK